MYKNKIMMTQQNQNNFTYIFVILSSTFVLHYWCFNFFVRIIIHKRWQLICESIFVKIDRWWLILFQQSAESILVGLTVWVWTQPQRRWRRFRVLPASCLGSRIANSATVVKSVSLRIYTLLTNHYTAKCACKDLSDLLESDVNGSKTITVLMAAIKFLKHGN